MSDMVDFQIISRGISDPSVLKAMREVDRSLFIPDSSKKYSFDDSPLPIGFGQTISQPYIVAYMTEKLQPKQGYRVLEIGTGSGYQSAVLSRIVSKVFSIERIPELALSASKCLKNNGFTNVQINNGDGYIGWKDQAPFDAIIATAASPIIPEPLIDQLQDPGKMIIPIGPANGTQYLTLILKSKKTILHKRLIAVRFVPFISEKF